MYIETTMILYVCIAYPYSICTQNLPLFCVYIEPILIFYMCIKPTPILNVRIAKPYSKCTYSKTLF